MDLPALGAGGNFGVLVGHLMQEIRKRFTTMLTRLLD
jgi:hypothetical protein